MTTRIVASLVVGLASTAGILLGGCGGSQSHGAADEPPAIARVHTIKCGSCHTPPAPKTRSRDALQAAFGRHQSQKRVHLTDEQWSAMLEYLAASEPKAQPGRSGSSSSP